MARPKLTGGTLNAMQAWRSYPWRLIRADSCAPLSPVVQMALEEVLARRVGAGLRPPTVRFWAWSAPAAVLGRFQSVRNEVDQAAARRHGVEIVRRVTGGGTMFIEPAGAITYSIYAPPELVAGMSFVESYAFLDAWVVEALRALDIEVWYEPVNSMMSAHGKLAGAAQARRAGVVLHHTTMAFDMDQWRLHDVLRLDRERLSEKGVASVVRPVGPLRLQTSLNRETIVERLIHQVMGICGALGDRIADDEMHEAVRLAETKFSTDEWIYAIS